MQAKDIMTTPVVTVGLQATVREIAALMLERKVSALPVVGGEDMVRGIVSEGDLLCHQDIGTDAVGRSWWLEFFSDADTLAGRYSKSHGTHARDVMSADVYTVGENASLTEIAGILATRNIKRVPVVRDGKLVGIVSRADIVRTLAAGRRDEGGHGSDEDEVIRENVIEALKNQSWSSPWRTAVFVSNAVVELTGTVATEARRDASRIAAENVPGVIGVIDSRRMV